MLLISFSSDACLLSDPAICARANTWLISFILQRSRERLHGHNYRVSLLLRGAAPGVLAASMDAPDGGPSDGYLVDFGELKRVMRQLCAELNERFLLPTANAFIKHTTSGGQVSMTVNDGSVFSFPQGDVVAVPLSNVSVEELSILFARRFVEAVGVDHLRHRRVTQVTLAVAESAGQEARFTVDIQPARTASNASGCGRAS